MRVGSSAGTYSIKRRPIPVGAAEARADLVRLYRWWMDRCAPDGRAPVHRHIDPGLVKRLGLAGKIHIVDVATDDPANYRFRVFAKRVTLFGGRDFAGSRVGDLGEEYRNAVTEDYLIAAASEVPRLHDVDARWGSNHRSYQRLIVPFASVRGKADCLLVAVSFGDVVSGHAPGSRP